VSYVAKSNAKSCARLHLFLISSEPCKWYVSRNMAYLIQTSPARDLAKPLCQYLNYELGDPWLDMLELVRYKLGRYDATILNLESGTFTMSPAIVATKNYSQIKILVMVNRRRTMKSSKFHRDNHVSAFIFGSFSFRPKPLKAQLEAQLGVKANRARCVPRRAIGWASDPPCRQENKKRIIGPSL
jgi:hypothetical protein